MVKFKSYKISTTYGSNKKGGGGVEEEGNYTYKY